METSTYSAEFLATHHDVDEIFSLWYMLRCFGVNVDTASEVYWDNLGFIQNATLKYSLLKKKKFAMSYHKVCKAVAEGIIFLIKIASAGNFADCLTKFLPIADHNWLINGLFYGWLALGVCGGPYEFIVYVTFGVVLTLLNYMILRGSLINRSDSLYRTLGVCESV